MVAITTFLTAAAAVVGGAGVVSAEYLSVVNYIMQHGGGELSPCRNNADSYEIYSFKEPTPSWLGGCKSPGKNIAYSKGSNGSKLDGCNAGGYSNGYRVCLTSYGANVYNSKGQHQRCTKDDKVLMFCPSGGCIDRIKRVFVCQGVWHK